MKIEHTNHLDSLGDLNDILIKYNAHINDISALHGFYSAIACSPIGIMPGAAHKIIWGGDAPVWSDMSEAMLFTETSIAFMLHTANTIDDVNEHYTPLVYREGDSEGMLIVDDWIMGFVEGISFTAESWKILLDDKKIRSYYCQLLGCIITSTQMQSGHYPKRTLRKISRKLP